VGPSNGFQIFRNSIKILDVAFIPCRVLCTRPSISQKLICRCAITPLNSMRRLRNFVWLLHRSNDCPAWEYPKHRSVPRNNGKYFPRSARRWSVFRWYWYLHKLLCFSPAPYQIVLCLLQLHGYAVNPMKCEWAVKETDWLGYWFTPSGLKPRSKKIQAIQQIQPPTNLKPLWIFICAVNYDRDICGPAVPTCCRISSAS
jgi:hypothetical protein